MFYRPGDKNAPWGILGRFNAVLGFARSRRKAGRVIFIPLPAGEATFRRLASRRAQKTPVEELPKDREHRTWAHKPLMRKLTRNLTAAGNMMNTVRDTLAVQKAGGYKPLWKRSICYHNANQQHLHPLGPLVFRSGVRSRPSCVGRLPRGGDASQSNSICIRPSPKNWAASKRRIRLKVG